MDENLDGVENDEIDVLFLQDQYVFQFFIMSKGLFQSANER